MLTRKHCLSCGRDYTPAQWPGLMILAVQIISADEPGERDMCLEWRKCLCSNSIQVDLADPDNELFQVTSTVAARSTRPESGGAEVLVTPESSTSDSSTAEMEDGHDVGANYSPAVGPSPADMVEEKRAA